MAENISANEHSVEEMRQWFATNVQNFNSSMAVTLKDVTQGFDTSRIPAINKAELKKYIRNIGSYEKQLRETARYLYYRSNIFFRLVNFYADMWCLNIRKVTPDYKFTSTNNGDNFIKSYERTLDMLEKMNLQGNMIEALINVYIQDAYCAIAYYDDSGMFFYPIPLDEIMFETRYNTGDLGFAIDMSKWQSKKRQKIIEYLGEPLSSMYKEYQRTKIKYQHCPDEYAFALKYRVDDLNTIIPVFLSLFIQIANLEDLIDIQADADALSIFKLIYLPMKVHNASKNVNDFEISPETSKKYFKKILDDGVIPDGIGAAMVPGDELKVIDFDNSTDKDITSTQSAENAILSTSGAGAVINSSKITTSAAFEAWLLEEENFAMSTLLPQINGFTNRFLKLRLGNSAAHVEHVEVSVYTKNKYAEALLKSDQHSFSNRLLYNTCLGISERETMAFEYLENQLLKLPELMNHPLSSSYTQSGNDNGYTSEIGQGAPTKDSGNLTPEGDRSRNK